MNMLKHVAERIEVKRSKSKKYRDKFKTMIGLNLIKLEEDYFKIVNDTEVYYDIHIDIKRYEIPYKTMD